MTEFTIYREYTGRLDDLDLEVRITGRITSSGCPAKTYGPPENCYPAEASEWEILTIAVRSEAEFVPAEQWFTIKDLDHLWAWAEDLDLQDEIDSVLAADLEAEAEFRSALRRGD